MTIREVSAMTGMREDTLRYYEQIGVIPQVPRNKGGIRTYQEPVLQKIFLVQKLKAAGMPLKGIKQYMEAPAKEEQPLTAQRRLLEQTKSELLHKIGSLQFCMQQAQQLLDEMGMEQ